MSRIFISYSRADEENVKIISQDISSLGHETWFDRELSGGQNWWDVILAEIRNTDIFVFILSPESRESSACSKEYEYAHLLGKPIIPIQVANGVSINLLPPALSGIQIVNYVKANKEAAFRLAKSLSEITTFSHLPDPLPTAPDVPISYLGNITQQIETSPDLNFEQQSGILLDIKQYLRDSDTNDDDAVTLLKKLRKRRDLYASIAVELDGIITEESEITLQLNNSGNSEKSSTLDPLVNTLLSKEKTKGKRINPNITTKDKKIRISLGVLLIVSSLFFHGNLLIIIIGFVLLITGLMGFCPIYKLVSKKKITENNTTSSNNSVTDSANNSTND